MPSVELPTALRTALVSAVAVLTDAGLDSPWVDAELLAAHVLGVPRGRLRLVDALTAEEHQRYRELVTRRATRVPLQHLTGTAPFRNLDLAVGPGVFVPRPETELLVDWALTRLSGLAAPVVVDLCSGSGAIALAVAEECPTATVYAVERDEQALSWLRRNAALRADGGDRPIEVVAADIAAVTEPGVLSALVGHVDVVLCNPPYVPDGAAVGPEVAGHDPALAVFGGPDGLAVIRQVIPQAVRLLRSGGWLGMEHDDTHPVAVPDLLRTAGFADVADHRDLAGRPRFATGRWPAVGGLADCTP
ncbi:MAG TPA: peptide chain release factor N(5)-glutamine methyltransferase [Micromonosporaceae bacterium]|nr:peptide chain release factor N(5)-glutamine methyltransferase [Micromonosporaceae bacterium]